MRLWIAALIFVISTLGCIHVPQPTPPTPPTPPGPPNPPAVEVGKLAVLIIEDVSQRDKLPTPQKEAMYSAKVRQYFTSHCDREPDGKTPQFRHLDFESDVSHESDFWKQGMALPHDSLPWLVITNGKAGASGPYPLNEDDLLAIAKKFGGP